MNNPNNQKFRPYFTPSELAEVIRCLKAAPTTSMPLLRYLESFSLKITHGILSPQVTLQPSTEEKLGFAQQAIQQSAQELWQEWLISPDKMTPPQMARIQQYRWENDMMDPTEVAAYEESILASSSSSSIKKGT